MVGIVIIKELNEKFPQTCEINEMNCEESCEAREMKTKQKTVLPPKH
jgi:hypothetical protein